MKKNALGKHCGNNVFHNVCYAVGTLKTFDSHISVVVCSFLKFRRSQNGVLQNGLRLYQMKNYMSKLKAFHDIIVALNNTDFVDLLIEIKFTRSQLKIKLFTPN